MAPLISFVNILALGLAALIVPLIILYLLKPRPKNVKFPSIMLITKIDKSKRFSSFFRKFLKDPLFLVQLLILLLLILAIANPFFLSPQVKNPRTNAVFIFDASASMQATDVFPSRFGKAKELGKKILHDLHPESKITIIFAGKVPLLMLKESEDREVAGQIMESLVPSDAPTNLEDAILFGNDLLASTERGFERKIYLFSDFSQVGDVKLGKGISLHQGIQVNFIKVNNRGKNVGIISITGKRFLDERENYYLTLTVKNFNLEDREVTLDIVMDNKPITSLKKSIPGNSSSLFYWKGNCSFQEHALVARIREGDDFELDNSAYWILPEIRKHTLLLITNSDNYLKYALSSNPDFTLKVAKPPVIPKIGVNDYDAVILGNFDTDLILPGTFLDLRNYLEGGGNLILVASPGLVQHKNNINLYSTLPLELEKVIAARSVVKGETEHEILEDVSLDNVILERYVKNCLKSNQSTVIATVKTSPLIAVGVHGQGRVAYVGINSEPEWSNFYLSSSLPIFWSQLIGWMARQEYFSKENYKAGEHVFFQKKLSLITPSQRTLTAEEIILDEVGIYSGNISSEQFQRIAVNLESEGESNIAASLEVKTINDPQFNLIPELTEEPTFLLEYLLILALLFLLVETILYQRRGLI